MKKSYLLYITLFLFLIIIILFTIFIIQNPNNTAKKINSAEHKNINIKKDIEKNYKKKNYIKKKKYTKLNKEIIKKEYLSTKYIIDNNKYQIESKIKEDFKRSKIKIDAIEIIKYKKNNKIYYNALVFQERDGFVSNDNIYMITINFIKNKINIIDRRIISNVYRIN